jgi:hypothetical protein
MICAEDKEPSRSQRSEKRDEGRLSKSQALLRLRINNGGDYCFPLALFRVRKIEAPFILISD